MMWTVQIVLIILNLGPYWHTRGHCLGQQWREVTSTMQRVITQLSKRETCKNSVSTAWVHLGTSRTFDERLFGGIWQDAKSKAVHRADGLSTRRRSAAWALGSLQLRRVPSDSPAPPCSHQRGWSGPNPWGISVAEWWVRDPRLCS